MGAMVRLPSTVLWGKRLKLWKTIPRSMRMALMFSFGSLIFLPSTRMVPLSMVSSRLMERSRVDLPEPLGPMMTTFSPERMSRETFLRAARLPKNLYTFLMRMMGSVSVIMA